MLAFVSSYRLLDKLVTRWKSPQCCVNVAVRTKSPGADEGHEWTNLKLPLFSALQCVKTVFTEPKEAGEDFGDMLASFRRVNEAAKVSQLERVRLGSQARAAPSGPSQSAAEAPASTLAKAHIDIADSGDETEPDDDGSDDDDDVLDGGSKGKRARTDADMSALVPAAAVGSAASQHSAPGASAASFDYGEDDGSDVDIAITTMPAATGNAASDQAASGRASPYSVSIAKQSSTPTSAAAASVTGKAAASARGGKRGARKPRDPSKSKRKRWTDADRARAMTKYEQLVARLGDDSAGHIGTGDSAAASARGGSEASHSGAASATVALAEAASAAAADDTQRDVFNSQPLVTGGLMVAVARGKASEGLDFSDHHARCVVVIGIPYANVSESLVALKRAYQDRQVKRAAAAAGGSAGVAGIPMPITGAQWYKQQAFRALNQALGRCIRHRHDYGSIILLDPRFNDEIDSLSKWARPAVRTGVLLPTAVREQQRFFEGLLASPPGTT